MGEPETTELHNPAGHNSKPPAPQGGKKKVNYWLISGIAIAAFIVIAFWTSSEPPAHRELKDNRAKWDEAHITHYKMTVSCIVCGDYADQMPWTIEVQDDKMISIINAQGKSVSANYRGSRQIIDVGIDRLTINGLFEDIEFRYSNGAPKVEVAYDPTYGYPVDMNINPWSEPCCKGYTVTVSDFEVLP